MDPFEPIPQPIPQPISQPLPGTKLGGPRARPPRSVPGHFAPIPALSAIPRFLALGLGWLIFLWIVGPLAAQPLPPPFDPQTEIDRLVEDIWWNHEQVVSGLGLAAEQRQRMDGHLRTYLEQRLVRTRETPRRDPFRQALQQGDLQAAAASLEIRSQRVAEASVAEGRMMLAVLAELEGEQLTGLREQFPRVLRARWMMLLSDEGRGRQGLGRRGQGGRPLVPGAVPAAPGSVDGPGGMK